MKVLKTITKLISSVILGVVLGMIASAAIEIYISDPYEYEPEELPEPVYFVNSDIQNFEKSA